MFWGELQGKSVGQNNQAKARSDDRAILKWILDFEFVWNLVLGIWDFQVSCCERSGFVENDVNLSYEIAERYIIINLKEQTGSSKEVSYQDHWCFWVNSPGRSQ
jgi:hypothetical protein